MLTVKRLSRTAWVRAVVCWLGSLYIRLVHALGRWETVRGEIPAGFWDRNEPFILAFWHGRLLMIPYAWRRGLIVRMLVSQHIDGELITRTVKHLGIDSVRGSSSKGGASALRAVLAALKKGEYVGFTPDGPRGPRMRASTGVITAARLSGAPIIPIACASSRSRVLNSWDRFVLTLPGGRGCYVWGAPISVPRDADEAAIEAARQKLEQEMNAIAAEADRRCGQPVIEPAPAPARAVDELADSAVP